MRQLQWPTLQQWGCDHRWHVTHTRSGGATEPWPRVRYPRCRRCGLHVRTEEHLSVPWDEQHLVAQVMALLPAGEAVRLRDQGITEFPLGRLNTILARHGLVIHASTGPDVTRAEACADPHGRVARYEVFELRNATTRRKRNI